MIDKDIYEFINRFDCKNAVERERILTHPSDQLECIKTLMTIIQKVSKLSTLQYTVTLIDDLLIENKNRVDLFHQYSRKYKENIYQTFGKMLYLQDDYLVHQAARILTKLACWSVERMPDKELRDLIQWFIERLVDKNPFKETLCRCLQMMFRIDFYRMAFYKMDGVKQLVKYLDGSLGTANSKDQMQYQVTCCLWLLTFNEHIATRIQAGYKLIPVLADILNGTEKEKVKRIIFATFRNLLEKPSDSDVMKENCLCMLQCKVKKLIDLLLQSNIEDPDLSDDLGFLNSKLETLVMDVTSFDEYTLELTSNRLNWSPCHKSDKFWRENAQRLNENNFYLVKKLIDILKQSNNPQTLEIALNDIGEYVRYYSRGKK